MRFPQGHESSCCSPLLPLSSVRSLRYEYFFKTVGNFMQLSFLGSKSVQTHRTTTSNVCMYTYLYSTYIIYIYIYSYIWLLYAYDKTGYMTLQMLLWYLSFGYHQHLLCLCQSLNLICTSTCQGWDVQEKRPEYVR